MAAAKKRNAPIAPVDQPMRHLFQCEGRFLGEHFLRGGVRKRCGPIRKHPFLQDRDLFDGKVGTRSAVTRMRTRTLFLLPLLGHFTLALLVFLVFFFFGLFFDEKNGASSLRDDNVQLMDEVDSEPSIRAAHVTDASHNLLVKGVLLLMLSLSCLVGLARTQQKANQ